MPLALARTCNYTQPVPTRIPPLTNLWQCCLASSHSAAHSTIQLLFVCQPPRNKHPIPPCSSRLTLTMPSILLAVLHRLLQRAVHRALHLLPVCYQCRLIATSSYAALHPALASRPTIPRIPSAALHQLLPRCCPWFPAVAIRLPTSNKHPEPCSIPNGDTAQAYRLQRCISCCHDAVHGVLQQLYVC
jgi:hypothetical protein